MKNGKARMDFGIGRLVCAATFALVLSGPAWAADPDAPSTTPTQTGQSFEIHDSADSPPLNYRSEADERYNTPAQRDAEMYAEQYEHERDEKLAKEKAMLSNMNTSTAPGGQIGGNVGAMDAGFPPKAPY